MMNLIKNISFYLVLSAACNFLSHKLESPFLINFLKENLVTLQIALLAINVTTLSIIMGKLRELKDRYSLNFDNTLKSIKLTIYEQASLIPLSIIFLVCKESKLLNTYFKNPSFVIDSLLILVFFYAIHILFDTAKGVFVIITAENNK